MIFFPLLVAACGWAMDASPNRLSRSYGRFNKLVDQSTPYLCGTTQFATSEEAAAYEEWLKAKVAASLADERPPVAHDVVMAETNAIIEEARRRQRAW